MYLFKKIINDSLIKNALYLMITNLFNLLFGFFFWVTAARYYTPEEVGTFSVLLSAMFLISVVSSLGFNISFLYYLPREYKNANRIINSCLTTSIAASIIFSIIFIAGIDIWAKPLKSIFDSVELVLLFITVTSATTVSGLLSDTFTAGRRSVFYTAKESFFGFIKILPLPLFIGFDAIGIFFAWGIGVILAVLLGFIFLLKVWEGYLPVLTFDPIIKKMARYSGGNYLAGIFLILPRLVLPIMIASIISVEATAFFYIAMTVSGLLYGVSQSISFSLLAESSKSGDLQDKIGKSIRFNILLLIPGMLVFILFGKYVLHLFNPVYAEQATITLMILAVTSLPLSVNTIFASVRNTQKKVSSVLKINFAIAIITLVLAVPLIGHFGIEGAATAYLVGNIAAALVVIYRMKDPVKFMTEQILKLI